MTKRNAETEVKSYKKPRQEEVPTFHSEDFKVGSRVQVLWEMHDPTTDECDLVYFSASVKEAREDGTYVLAYDGIKDYSDAQEDEVKLVDQETLYSVKDDGNQKWRKLVPMVQISEILERDAYCPLGHVLSRDLANESIRICDCCLTGYYTTNGQWECKAESTCQDWGVCDNCLDDYLKTGAWSFSEEEADQIIDFRDHLAEIEDMAAAEAEQFMKQIGHLPFLMQSTIAHGYREFVDVMTNGVKDLYRRHGCDYVITANDIRDIAQRLKRDSTPRDH